MAEPIAQYEIKYKLSKLLDNAPDEINGENYTYEIKLQHLIFDEHSNAFKWMDYLTIDRILLTKNDLDIEQSLIYDVYDETLYNTTGIDLQLIVIPQPKIEYSQSSLWLFGLTPEQVGVFYNDVFNYKTQIFTIKNNSI